MSIRVTGTLTDPMGIAEVATIRVTSTITNTGVLEYSTAQINTESDGSYDFNLLNGTFDIEVNGDDEYFEQGEVAVDDSVLTNASYTLQELLLL